VSGNSKGIKYPSNMTIMAPTLYPNPWADIFVAVNAAPNKDNDNVVARVDYTASNGDSCSVFRNPPLWRKLQIIRDGLILTIRIGLSAAFRFTGAN
jgi:hypothetical protein